MKDIVKNGLSHSIKLCRKVLSTLQKRNYKIMNLKRTKEEIELLQRN